MFNFKNRLIFIFKSNKGFTLLELLIVVLIIGILAGVIISVVNPVAQQNRARDAITVSALNKVVLATESYYSAYGVVPQGSNFFNGLIDASTQPSGCNNSTTYCLFTINSVSLPNTCSSSYLGKGSTQCNFYYLPIDSDSYNIVAKAHGSDSLYVYRSTSTSKKMQLCQNGTSVPSESKCQDLN